MNEGNVIVTESRGHPPDIDDGQDIEVYIDRIDEVADEYIRSLVNPDDITHPMIFTGMIHYIHNQLFKPCRRNQKIYQKNTYQNTTNSILPYDDIDTLDHVFDIYCGLCYKYRQAPTMLEYCILTGINYDTINTWLNGAVRTKLHTETAKKWKKTCEEALEKKAIENNGVGAIFALKCAHGWRETAPLPAPENNLVGAVDSPEVIMARHTGAALPEPPVLDD